MTWSPAGQKLLLLASLALAPGCGEDMTHAKRLKFLIGQWVATAMERSCTLQSRTDTDIVWDEVLEWDGEILVEGPNTTMLNPKVLTEYTIDGELKVTIGDPLGDHLEIQQSRPAVLRIADRTFEGPLNATIGNDFISIPRTGFRKGMKEIKVAGTIALPKIALKRDVPVTVRLTPRSQFGKLPPLADVHFQSNGSAILSSAVKSSVDAKWDIDGQDLTLALAQWKTRKVHLKAEKKSKKSMSLTWNSKLHGTEIDADPEQVSVQCSDTQHFVNRAHK